MAISGCAKLYAEESEGARGDKKGGQREVK